MIRIPETNIRKAEVMRPPHGWLPYAVRITVDVTEAMVKGQYGQLRSDPVQCWTLLGGGLGEGPNGEKDAKQVVRLLQVRSRVHWTALWDSVAYDNFSIYTLFPHYPRKMTKSVYYDTRRSFGSGGEWISW